MDNLEELYKFLETYKLPRLNQEEVENLNRLITSNVIELAITKFPTIKVQEKITSQMNSTKHLKKTNTYASQTIPKNRREILPNSFYKTSITQIPKPEERHYKKHTKNYRPISLINTDANILNKILATKFNINRIIHHDKVRFIPGMQEWVKSANQST